ncbi:hypothetical protein ACJX0J_038785 [Zea mays]
MESFSFVFIMKMISEGWEPLFEETKTFCLANDIPIPNMEDMVPRFGRSRKGGRNNITQEHFFRIDTFYAAIDAITTELEDLSKIMVRLERHILALLLSRDIFK